MLETPKKKKKKNATWLVVSSGKKKWWVHTSVTYNLPCSGLQQKLYNFL